MCLVESIKKEFEKRFAHLSTLDRTILDMSKFLLFLKVMDAQDRRKERVVALASGSNGTMGLHQATKFQ